MPDPGQINADMLAFWDGQGGHTWVTRQAHTDATLKEVTRALLEFAAPQPGERVLDVGCGCGAPTLEFARAVGPTGRVAAVDISGPMLAEGRARARSAGITNIDWRQIDPATAALDGFDLLTSAFGVMFFGDPVSAFTNLRRTAAAGSRMAIVCWRPLAENPWMGVPMEAVSRHLPPRPPPDPHAPGMFAFAEPERVAEIFAASGWGTPRFEALDLELDIAAGRGLEEAVLQSTQIGAINSWLRDQPDNIQATAVASIREALEPFTTDAHVRLPGAMWLIASEPA